MSQSPEQKREELNQWWVQWNSRLIWLTIIGLMLIIFFTSIDYSKTYWNFDKLGLNQLILSGIVTFLLLYKYISKIKIGSVIEIETREALREGLRGIENVTKALEHTINALPQSAYENENVSEAKERLTQAKKQIRISSQILDNLDYSIEY